MASTRAASTGETAVVKTPSASRCWNGVSVALALLLAGCPLSHGRVDDAGSPAPAADAATSCADRRIVPYEGDGCSDAVRGCIRRCSGEDCPIDCVETEAECTRCFRKTILGCVNERSCQARWSEFVCCTEGKPACLGLADVDLLSCAPSCAPDFERYMSCLDESVTMECIARTSATCGLGI